MNHLEIGITQENVLEISWERNERHNLLVNIDISIFYIVFDMYNVMRTQFQHNK